MMEICKISILLYREVIKYLNPVVCHKMYYAVTEYMALESPSELKHEM